MPRNSTTAEGIARILCPCGCGADMTPRQQQEVRWDEPLPPWRQITNPYPRFTQEGTVQRAAERGASIEVAPADVLQLDIDGPEAYERFEVSISLWQTCSSLPALGKIVERDSRTAGHKHITIELPTEYSVPDRIMLQALLGSDLKRELLSLASHYNGHETPIVFYRPQEESNAASQQAGPGDGVDGNTHGSVGGRATATSVRNGLDRLRESVDRRAVAQRLARDFISSLDASAEDLF